MLKDSIYLSLLTICIFIFAPLSCTTPGLESYYSEVMKDITDNCTLDKYNHPIRVFVHFGDLEDGVLGYCRNFINAYEISIDKHNWDKMDEGDRFGLIAHETIHCAFLQDHVDNPEDIMYPYLVKITKVRAKSELKRYINLYCKGG